ncbi:MAG: hypothetical protein QXH42_07090 [Thermoplasmata archaeon]
MNASGPHERTAFYDFSNTWIFSRWSIVMETNRAVLMRNIWFLNERWSLGTPMPAAQERARHVAVYDDTDRLVIVHGGYCWRAGMQEPIYTQPLLTLDPATGIWTERGPSMLPAGAAGVWNPRDRASLSAGGWNISQGSRLFTGRRGRGSHRTAPGSASPTCRRRGTASVRSGTPTTVLCSSSAG